MSSFTASCMEDMREGERLVIIPDHNLVYRVDSENRLSTTFQYLFKKLESLLGATVYDVNKVNSRFDIRVGKISLPTC